jgi:hypothetical protein
MIKIEAVVDLWNTAMVSNSKIKQLLRYVMSVQASKRQSQVPPPEHVELPKMFKDALHMIVAFLAIQKLDQDKDNSLEWIRGDYIPPRLLGYFPFAPVSRFVNLTEVAKELLWGQHVKFDSGDGIRKWGVALRKNESKRFETWIEIELAIIRGETFATLSLMTK